MNNTVVKNKNNDYNEVKLPFDGFVNVNEVIAKRRHLRDIAAVNLRAVTDDAGSKDSEKQEDNR